MATINKANTAQGINIQLNLSQTEAARLVTMLEIYEDACDRFSVHRAQHYINLSANIRNSISEVL